MDRVAQTPPLPSLKKLKREAAQRRKAHARSLKLRAEEQERLQRLEIDALVEQQRLQRIERQRREEAAARLASSTVHQQTNGKSKGGKHSHHNDRSGGNEDSRKQQKDGGCGWRGGKEAQREKMAQKGLGSAADSRRRLARGPRNGSPADALSMIPSEDHRVLSTEYQAAGTQALMRVTLLAAGFVIGARGISARLIGQVTGAIVQSWTESCRADVMPIRLFRIQGKKSMVQAAVSLIEQAVAKYKDLCECKRRGEFVQREHIINGVEFYYQPPPRKAFSLSSELRCSAAKVGAPMAIPAPPALSLPSAPLAAFAPHHVWLQHLHAHQQHLLLQQQGQKNRQQDPKPAVSTPPPPPHQDLQIHLGHHFLGEQQRSLFDWQHAQQQHQEAAQALESPQTQPPVDQNPEDIVEDYSPVEPHSRQPSLQESVSSLEQALEKVRLEHDFLQQNRKNGEVEPQKIDNVQAKESESARWSDLVQKRERQRQREPAAAQAGSSLFSIFGNGGLPLPIAQSCSRPEGGGVAASALMNSSMPTSPFDFPTCDFFRDSLRTFPFAQQQEYAGSAPRLGLFGRQKRDGDESLCVVCLEQPGGVRLMACGHGSFCLSCAQGMANCPLCCETIVGSQSLGSAKLAAPVAAAPARALNASTNLNNMAPSSTSYRLWSWLPGASA